MIIVNLQWQGAKARSAFFGPTTAWEVDALNKNTTRILKSYLVTPQSIEKMEARKKWENIICMEIHFHCFGCCYTQSHILKLWGLFMVDCWMTTLQSLILWATSVGCLVNPIPLLNTPQNHAEPIVLVLELQILGTLQWDCLINFNIDIYWSWFINQV